MLPVLCLIKSITSLPHPSVNIVCASSVNTLLLRTRCPCFSLSEVLKLLILFPLVLSSSVHPSLGVHSKKWEDQHRIRRGHHLQPDGRQGQHLQGHEGVSGGVQRKKMLVQRKAGGKFERLWKELDGSCSALILQVVFCVTPGGHQLVDQRRSQRYHQTVLGSASHYGEVQAL